MFDWATPPVDDIDDLAMAATDLLNQYRKKGMDDQVQRSIVKKTFEADNLEKLEGLIAKFEAAIQVHDANLAAAHAALEASEFPDMDQSFSSIPSFSTDMPSSGDTECNTNLKGTEGNSDANSQLGEVDMTSRCTKRISRPQRKELRRHQAKHNATVLAAARACNARTGRTPTATGRCLLSEFRAFAFEYRRKYLQGILTKPYCKQWSRPSRNCTLMHHDVLNPLSPGKSEKRAVRENDIGLLVIAQSMGMLKKAETVEKKLSFRPAIIPMGAPKDLVCRGATALAPDWTPLRIEPPLQNVFLPLFEW
jgi:hypothetical protein